MADAVDRSSDTQSPPVAADLANDHDTNPRPDNRDDPEGSTVSPAVATYYWRRPGHPAPADDIKPRRPLMITDI